MADKKVIAVDTVPNLMELDHPWIQEYFNGPRGRAALTAQALDELRQHMDQPIAAHAVAHHAVLVTANRVHMSRIAGLEVEDWAERT